MNEDEAWKQAQEHYRKWGVKLKDLSVRDWFLTGWHMGAKENNAQYLDDMFKMFEGMKDAKRNKRIASVSSPASASRRRVKGRNAAKRVPRLVSRGR